MTSYGYEPLPPADQTAVNEEHESLLPTSTSHSTHPHSEKPSKFGFLNFCRDSGESGERIDRSHGNSCVIGMALGAGFVGGILSVLSYQYFSPTSCVYDASLRHSPLTFHPATGAVPQVAEFSFPGDIGATEAHEYPPPSPTNALPGMFPTEIGYAGPTITGAEPGLVLTAGSYPSWGGVDGLLRPKLWDASSSNDANPTPSWIEEDTSTGGKHKHKKFDIFQHWGNLSPFYSVPPDSFGIKSSTGAEVPPTCELKGVHILHRHGARYPTGRCKCRSVLFYEPLV